MSEWKDNEEHPIDERHCNTDCLLVRFKDEAIGTTHTDTLSDIDITIAISYMRSNGVVYFADGLSTTGIPVDGIFSWCEIPKI